MCRHWRVAWKACCSEVLNGVLVALGELNIGQLTILSVAWEFLENTDVNMLVTSDMDLKTIKANSLHCTHLGKPLIMYNNT